MRITPASHSIGIDLAWKPGNPSSIAVLNADAHLIEYHYTASLDEMLALISRYPQSRIGVDAPLIIPNATGHRPNEREFLKVFARYGLGLHAANTTLFAKRFPRYAGFELYARLTAEGFDFAEGNLFEVYPHATILALFNNGKVLRYKASAPKPQRLAALKRLQTDLFEVLTVPNRCQTDLNTLKGKALKAEEDFLDSLVCAYTLHYCTAHDALCFGNNAVGKLLTPAPHDGLGR
jgi:predicted RNase H-like nuclease